MSRLSSSIEVSFRSPPLHPLNSLSREVPALNVTFTGRPFTYDIGSELLVPMRQPRLARKALRRLPLPLLHRDRVVRSPEHAQGSPLPGQLKWNVAQTISGSSESRLAVATLLETLAAQGSTRERAVQPTLSETTPPVPLSTRFSGPEGSSAKARETGEALRVKRGPRRGTPAGPASGPFERSPLV
ncbi:hypothetical protein JCM21900_002815 [Sporobolomyces salmonicolor]